MVNRLAPIQRRAARRRRGVIDEHPHGYSRREAQEGVAEFVEDVQNVERAGAPAMTRPPPKGNCVNAKSGNLRSHRRGDCNRGGGAPVAGWRCVYLPRLPVPLSTMVFWLVSPNGLVCRF